MTPPIRFLAVVVCGWTIARSLMLIGDSPPNMQTHLPPSVATFAQSSASSFTVSSFTASLPGSATLKVTLRPDQPRLLPALSVAVAHHRSRFGRTGGPVEAPIAPTLRAGAIAFAMPMSLSTRADPQAKPALPTMLQPKPTRSIMPPMPVSPLRVPSRWSASTWLLARGGVETAVATNGLLGGSQAGARAMFRVNEDFARPISLSLRVSSPLRRDGVEAAAGVEWQPFANLPVRLLAERRQRVSGEGRSAFALLAHGGINDRPIAAGFLLDAYAQAGLVGARSRDLFADGGATLVRPVNDAVAIGGGAWGGVQPGSARLDIGPRATASAGRMRLSIDYRFRVAGDAAPASGPSLTIGTDF